MLRRVVAFGAAAFVVQGAAFAAPYLPVVGSPNSIQHSAVTTALDLSEMEPDGGFEIEGDTDFIGVGVTYWGAGGLEGQRYDLKYQKAMRVSEGSRARLLIDTPITILHVSKDPYDVPGFDSGNKTALSGTLSLGYEIPVQPNWFVTPRLAYGVSGAGRYFGGEGEILTASVTSRYKLPQVGRGDLTIGNMIAYSRTTDTFLTDPQAFNKDLDVWTFRNGIAYQLPLKSRMFGRQSSLRGSYTYTFLTGQDEQQYDKVHEVALSIGVRTREAEQKNRFEQLRVALMYTHAKNQFDSKAFPADYDAVTVIVGYRF